MLCDLNIPWPVTNYKDKPSEIEINVLKKILNVLIVLKYTHVAFNFELDPSLKFSKKEAGQIKLMNPIDFEHFKEFKNKIKIYSRITLTLNDPADFQGLRLFQNKFDLIAIQPTNEKALGMVITNLEVDIITFNYSDYLKFWLKNKSVHAAVFSKKRKFEIVYRPMFDPTKRANFINVCKNLVRASRLSGLFLSSGATLPAHIKSKFDLQILCEFINVSKHKISALLNENPTSVLLTGKLRVNSYKQTIIAGEDILSENIIANVNSAKRKLEESDTELKIIKKLSSC